MVVSWDIGLACGIILADGAMKRAPNTRVQSGSFNSHGYVSQVQLSAPGQSGTERLKNGQSGYSCTIPGPSARFEHEWVFEQSIFLPLPVHFSPRHSRDKQLP